MKKTNALRPIAQKLRARLQNKGSRRSLRAGTAILAGGMMFCGTAAADEVAFDTFNDLTLEPFTVASNGSTEEGAYDGWSAMDVDSWIAEQGSQLGRDQFFGAGTHNTALIADPDAWDDYTAAQPFGYNAYISRAYDLSGFTPSTLQISFDYQFASYDSQRGTVEVSFDNGATWQILLDQDSDTLGNSVLITESVSYSAGSDFNATSSNMLLRIGCTDADNDWWFAMDNIAVTTSDGFSDVEDFEGLSLEPFTVAGGGDGTDWTASIRTGTNREWTKDNSGMQTGSGDGTDFTQNIPNWTIDNSGNLGYSEEEAYNGWAALDVFSWADEQGGGGRTLFNLEDPHNTTLVADGDGFYDYDFALDGTPGAPPQAVNSYISRTYDMSTFDTSTVNIQFEYEFRLYGAQTGVAEVSFDNGTTFTRILELNSDDGNEGDILADLFNHTAGDGTIPTVNSSTMILRFGYLTADNDYWFAVDNIHIQADAGSFVLGDVNGDGVVSLLDVQPFVNALTNGIYIAAADINQDGVVSLLDVAPFVNLLTG